MKQLLMAVLVLLSVSSNAQTKLSDGGLLYKAGWCSFGKVDENGDVEWDEGNEVSMGIVIKDSHVSFDNEGRTQLDLFKLINDKYDETQKRKIYNYRAVDENREFCTFRATYYDDGGAMFCLFFKDYAISYEVAPSEAERTLTHDSPFKEQ